MDESKSLSEIAKKLLIGEYTRHIFLCIGDACCTAEAGAKAWDVLKDELKRRNLSLATGPCAWNGGDRDTEALVQAITERVMEALQGAGVS